MNNGNHSLEVPLIKLQVPIIGNLNETSTSSLSSTNSSTLVIPIINVFAPDEDIPIPVDITDIRDIELETQYIEEEFYNTNLLSPVYVANNTLDEAPVVFRNYCIRDSDGISDTYLQPFKIDETKNGDLLLRGNVSVSSENQVDQDS